MGFAFVSSATMFGLEALQVRVETDITQGLPKFKLVGLPDAATTEARERVRAAIKNSGLQFPRPCITINLAPAEVKKHGSAYDLPIAVSILVADDQIPDSDFLRETMFLGELALDGNLRSTNGVLPCVLLAKRLGLGAVVVPFENAREAALVQGISVHAVKTLAELVDALKDGRELPVVEYVEDASPSDFGIIASDFKDIVGQERAKRALEIAAAGGHNILFSGSPGSGKTLLARSLPGILPPLSFDESLEVTAIHSVNGVLPKDQVLIRHRPFRTPHHSASGVALVGGGSNPKPGEITLAHLGVLFLDEFPEFPKHALEHLRQPLEEGKVTVARASGTVVFPARFMLVAAMNPCPCGYAFDNERACTCAKASRTRYRQKISGPLMDRIDLVVEVPRLPLTSFSDGDREPSSTVADRVARARSFAQARYAGERIATNAELTSANLHTHCKLEKADAEYFQRAAESLKLSARGYARLIKVARTIADLEQTPTITRGHLMEALQFRSNLSADNQTGS